MDNDETDTIIPTHIFLIARSLLEIVSLGLIKTEYEMLKAETAAIILTNLGGLSHTLTLRNRTPDFILGAAGTD